MLKNIDIEQISNYVYCDSRLNQMNIKSKLLPNPYYDYPYLIIEDFFNKKECGAVNQFINLENDFKAAKLKTKDNINLQDETLDKTIRNTNIYKLDQTLENLYINRFNVFKKDIEDYFKQVITSSTGIQVLEYQKGFFYKAHSDDSSMLFENNELVGFNLVAKQRKLTTVLFTKECGEDFEGGELKFNFLYDNNLENIVYKPKKGDMIVFLSNPYFTHEVLPVKSGNRVTLVQWHNSFGD